MAVTAWGQTYIQATTPQEDPVQVGSLWIDTSSTAILKVCTSVSPYTFTTIVTAGIEDNAITNAKLRDSGALSVIGRSANSSGDPADISATAASDAVLRESGSVLGFGTIATGGIANDAVTDAKLRNSAAVSVIGRSANSSGDPADIAAASDDQFLRRRSSVLGFGSIVAGDLVGIAVPVEQTTTSTGAQNDFDLADEWTHLRCNNATALTFTGFTVNGATPTRNCVVILDNIGSSTVKVAHQDAGSTAANRAIAVSTAGQIVGASGRILCVYDVTTGRWRCALLDTGAGISVPFADLTFAASSGTWTVDSGDMARFAFWQRGQIVQYQIVIVDTDVGTASVTLNVNGASSLLPGGFDANVNGFVGAGLGVDAGAAEAMIMTRIASGNTIQFQKQSGSWSVTTSDNTDVEAMCFVRVS